MKADPTEPDLALTPDALVAMLIGATGAFRISAVTWTFQVALSEIERRLRNGGIARALKRWPRAVGPQGRRFVGVDAVLQRLMRSGELALNGRGLAIAYQVDPAWADRNRTLASALSPCEQNALNKGAQRLLASFNMLSKNDLASSPVGSPTI